jgi:uncharacterized membrane protein
MSSAASAPAGTLLRVLTAEGTSRLMAFSDAVVAIAITLLVLPLVDVVSARETRSIGEILTDHGTQFAMFLLSFAVIARMWWSHHNLGERMARGDSWIVILTLIWLLTVVFLPFPTALLGEIGNTRTVAAVYIGTFLVNVTCLAAQGARLARRPEMWREGWTAEHMRVWVAGWWANPVLAAVGLTLCLAVPGVGVWAMLLLFLDPVLTRLDLARRLPAGTA